MAKTMVVAGVMSGTSADGVDVALVRVRAGVQGPQVKLLGHRGFGYPKAVRERVLAVMGGEAMSAGEMSKLSWRLGEIYAECVEKTYAAVGVRAALIGVHGQTVYHQAGVEKYLGRAVRATWQMGEAAVLRERLGVPVVSDFRPADLAAGGQGAPLVPMLDWCLYRSATRNRVLLNLGGIANVTAIPAGAGVEGVLAFDTGPANMVVDALMQARFGKAFDKGGAVAASGKAHEGVVAEAMREAYFAGGPPKSCGREQFGEGYVARFAAMCARAGLGARDEVATATELTAVSVVDAYAKWCWAHLGQRAPAAKGTEVIASGGGVKNAFLMRRLTAGFAALGVSVRVAEDAQAKEAVAFALLAWLSWHGLVGNVVGATGARRGVVLGKISW